MTLIQRIEELFYNSPNGFVGIQQLYRITKNGRLIREIAHRLGYREVFKSKSKNIMGYGNINYAHLWRYTDDYKGAL